MRYDRRLDLKHVACFKKTLIFWIISALLTAVSWFMVD